MTDRSNKKRFSLFRVFLYDVFVITLGMVDMLMLFGDTGIRSLPLSLSDISSSTASAMRTVSSDGSDSHLNSLNTNCLPVRMYDAHKIILSSTHITFTTGLIENSCKTMYMCAYTKIIVPR